MCAVPRLLVVGPRNKTVTLTCMTFPWTRNPLFCYVARNMTVITETVNGPFSEPHKSSPEVDVFPEQLTDVRQISKSVAVIKHFTFPTNYRSFLTVHKPFRSSDTLWRLFKWNTWRHVIFCKFMSVFHCSLHIRLVQLFKCVAETIERIVTNMYIDIF